MVYFVLTLVALWVIGFTYALIKETSLGNSFTARKKRKKREKNIKRNKERYTALIKKAVGLPEALPEGYGVEVVDNKYDTYKVFRLSERHGKVQVDEFNFNAKLDPYSFGLLVRGIAWADHLMLEEKARKEDEVNEIIDRLNDSSGVKDDLKENDTAKKVNIYKPISAYPPKPSDYTKEEKEYNRFKMNKTHY